MRAGGGWGASRYVPSVLAVEGPRASACPPLAAMPSTATSQTGPLASALSLPKPVIALAAISDSIPFLSLSKLFLPFSFLVFLTDFGGLDSVGCVNGKNICSCFICLLLLLLLLLNIIIKYYIIVTSYYHLQACFAPFHYDYTFSLQVHIGDMFYNFFFSFLLGMEK